MIIKQLTINNFGSIDYFHADLDSALNVLDTYSSEDISSAVSILLCSKDTSLTETLHMTRNTCISAQILLDNKTCFLKAAPADEHSKNLRLSVTDSRGTDITDFYLYTMSHSLEQDITEKFDGKDNSAPLNLYRYRYAEENTPKSVSSFKNMRSSITHTKTFRQYLLQYIRSFQPEPINSKKEYTVFIDNQGRFQVNHPHIRRKTTLSETENMLFSYICFLSTTRFWESIENLRDIHHERKPLLIQNFLEFLDREADIPGLIRRTLQFSRQIIILTPPIDKKTKEKWIGE